MLLVACGDDDGEAGGAGSTASTTTSASTTTTSASTTAATTASTNTSASASSGGAGLCETATASAIIGANGGELAYCGATLVVPPGAVAADTTFTATEVLMPPAAPFERELASSVIRFEPAGPFDLPLDLTLPHAAVPTSYFEMARLDEAAGEYASFEPCGVTPTSIQQFVGVLGSYVALRDVNMYPDSSSGLGDGTIDADFLGEMTTYDLDEDPSSFGIYGAGPDGTRALTLRILRNIPDGLESLRVNLVIDPTGNAGSLVQVEWISTVTSTGYSFIDGLIGSDGSLTVREEGGRFIGEISANVAGGNPMTEIPFTATFDVAVEKYAFPPELSCPGGRG
jgi:hypothetical protein